MEALPGRNDVDDSTLPDRSPTWLYLLHSDIVSIDWLVNGGSYQGPMQKVRYQDALQVFRLSVPIFHKWQSDNMALP